MKLLDRINGSANRPLERAKILAEVPKPELYNYKGVQIQINSISLEGDRLAVDASASKNGARISVDNPLYFVNPPCCVPDGTTRTEIQDGIEVQLKNHKEDPGEALKEIVGQTILLFVK